MSEGTAPYVQIPGDLRDKLSHVDQISEAVLALAAKIEEINTLNKIAAGTDDGIAKAYHAQVDRPTEYLTTMVQEIGRIFGVKAEAGSAAASVLERAGEDAQDAASADWTAES
ncbi:hypothetical protein Kisp01_71860 [Kineosporia sp. NBRC 101677]|uniref:hypothetical protein n=1 Tax=Kineosporia sp. NBRC 101677 TaxID=3032197 RepID=UPI0024A37697|nr:hypothetical protein [Kineosporia sp. NBRC 101677]GLY20172.1 hypothetical protein Kisp01_71860 [Kineosporia sp. NBRC 101677]